MLLKGKGNRHLRESLLVRMISENARGKPWMRTTSALPRILDRLLSRLSKEPPNAAPLHKYEKLLKWTGFSTNSMSSKPKQQGRERDHRNRVERALRSGPIRTECPSL